MTRYALIGAGMMGQEHLRNIALLDGATVSAIADPDEGMRAQSLEVQGGTARIFTDWREMVSADLADIYLIASPNDAHHETLLALLPGNKPILCEKPMCTTVDHCREVVKLSEKRDAPLWVAMEYRYMPPVARLIDAVAGGTTGPAVMMSIREHRYPFLDKIGGWNRFNARTGGTLVEKCCHFWDLMRFTLKSDPIRVYASAGVDEGGAGGREMIDNAFVVIDFASGARGMLDLCMFAEAAHWQEVITVTGPVARVEARIPGPARFSAGGHEHQAEFAVARRSERREQAEEVFVDPAVLLAGDHHGSTFFQHQRVLELVRGNGSGPEVTATDGLWSVMIGAAAEESARTGQPVDLSAP